ncbi:MAG: anti-sigma factor antagonist [Oscillospiraceae bacterium]|nr:anti-sigma factor antagonist [Oscillospiraceae bacterium]MCD7767879.1 anti-sigma factor antagonist [Oscillospiraceae bacterium]MCD7903895.1 anti-sigma factor antagonist [Oscillospiraceae bacterium]MCD7934250.1 anti-sigma factor antagonist [Oscillospiraceae bacterium]
MGKTEGVAQMKVFSTYQDGRLTISLQGELDHHAAKETMTLIEKLLDEYMPRELALDFSPLTFMDSSGIALLLRLTRRLSGAGGRVWVEKARLQPRRVLEASGIGRMIRIKTEDEDSI